MGQPEPHQNLIFQPFLDSRYVISHSLKTYNSYKRALSLFEKFSKQSHNCEVSQLVLQMKNGTLDVYEMLNQYIVFLDKEGKRPASIKGWIPGIKGFLRQQGIKIYSEESRSLVRIPKRIRYREEPITKDILARLLHNLSPKLRTAVLVASASGMRIGEIVQLTISDVNFMSLPVKIRIRAETTKTRESRETFLTGEASLALQDYLKRAFDWDLNQRNERLHDKVIFGPKFRTKTEHKMDPHITATDSLRQALVSSIRKIPELAKLNENGRNSIHFHAFRKYFRTVVGNAVGRDFAEALMGHHFYLDTYYQLPDEKKRELYLNSEPHLTVSNYADIEKKIAENKGMQKDIEIFVRKILQESFPLHPILMDKVLDAQQ